MSPLALSRRAALLSAVSALGACAAPRAGTGAGPGAGPMPFDPVADFARAPVSPPLPRGEVRRIALTSCSNQDRDMPLFDKVAEARPDLLLMLGDNVYGSYTPEDPQLSDLRSAYFQMARREPFRRLVGSVPTLAVWDDHDFGRNDAGGDFAHKALAQRMFNAFWSIPQDSELRSRPGIYRSVTLGPVGRRVQVIILDTRFFRDPLVPTDQRGAPGRERYLPHPEASTADVLGEAQWAWLEARLREPADIRLIASSIQVVADGHGWEKWGNFPAARRRLYRLIGSTGAKGVMFVSGDRHYGSINRIAEDVAYPLVDLTASAINMGWGAMPGDRGTGVAEAGPRRIGPGYAPVNFGLVDIDWASRLLMLKLAGEQGQIVQDFRVAFGDIGLG